MLYPLFSANHEYRSNFHNTAYWENSQAETNDNSPPSLFSFVPDAAVHQLLRGRSKVVFFACFTHVITNSLKNQHSSSLFFLRCGSCESRSAFTHLYSLYTYYYCIRSRKNTYQNTYLMLVRIYYNGCVPRHPLLVAVKL